MRNTPLKAFASPLKNNVEELSKKAKVQIEKDKSLANEPSYQLRRKKTIPMEGYIVPPTKK
jgi:hypothetical protein